MGWVCPWLPCACSQHRASEPSELPGQPSGTILAFRTVATVGSPGTASEFPAIQFFIWVYREQGLDPGMEESTALLANCPGKTLRKTNVEEAREVGKG